MMMIMMVFESRRGGKRKDRLKREVNTKAEM
jgi:hypothetical protein